LTAYEARTKLEKEQTLNIYLTERKAFAASLKQNDFTYASFQLWQEGIARYTQYRMAELAGRKMKPSTAFHSLPDFVPFDKEADRLLAATLQEMRDLDLTKWERTVFYPFGAVEGLLLDGLDPSWRSRYLNDKFELSRFYEPVHTRTQ
jgi:hypothetical protein